MLAWVCVDMCKFCFCAGVRVVPVRGEGGEGVVVVWGGGVLRVGTPFGVEGDF